jgi:hypothetical protein
MASKLDTVVGLSTATHALMDAIEADDDANEYFDSALEVINAKSPELVKAFQDARVAFPAAFAALPGTIKEGNATKGK